MPTANEIENYRGDKDLAFGSNALPAFSTDAIIDSSPVIAAWDRYAQNKLNVALQNQAELKRKQLAADAALREEINLGNYKVIPEDVPLFMKKWDEMKASLKDPSTLSGWLSNDPSNAGFQKLQSQFDYLHQFASMSTQQGAHADVTYNDASGNPDKYVDPFTDINNYRKIGDPYKRMNEVLEPKPNISLDFPAYVAKLKNSITPRQELTTDIVNGRYVDTTEIFYDADKIDAATKVDYETNKKFRAEADEAFGELQRSDPATAQAIGSAQKYASATAWDMLNGGSRVIAKNPFFSPYERAQATQDAKPQDSWLVDFMTELQNPESDKFVYYTNQSDPIPNLKVAPSPSQSLTINGKPIGAFAWKDGQLFAIPKSNWIYDQAKGSYQIIPTKDKEGKPTLPPNLIPIDQSWSQIIQPFVENQYHGQGSYTVGQDLQNYAIKTNQATKLGIPQQQGTQQKQEQKTESKEDKSMIRVSLNGKIGEIPADQWEAFKKKYPNAVKQ